MAPFSVSCRRAIDEPTPTSTLILLCKHRSKLNRYLMSEQNPEDLIQTRLLPHAGWDTRKRRPANLRARSQHTVFIGLLAVCLVAGAIDPFVPESSQIPRLLAFSIGLLAVALLSCGAITTVMSDVTKSSCRCVFASSCLAGIAVPLYLLLTRGWRGIFSIVLSDFFLAACISLAYLAAFIAHISYGSAVFVVATCLRGQGVLEASRAGTAPLCE